MSERMHFRNLPKEKWLQIESTVRLLKNSGIKEKPHKNQSQEQAFYSAAYKMTMINK